MSEKALLLEARLATLEYMLQRLYMITYASNKTPEETIRAAHSAILEKRRTERWPTKDPAQAALASGAFEDSFAEFLSGLELMLEDQGLLKK
ncbi:MAG: hypothetical protein H3C55_05740 [Pseudorhodoplanes sp.]|nr:hypothetical protein [Pseudorhodoplanes sp.]MBW7948835.1 hypothetical protein [Pseudorhodoplanes sp.]